MFTKTKIALVTAFVLSSGVAALMATAPASAQLFYSNDPAAGDGSEAAALPGYGANRGMDYGYAPVSRQLRDYAVTTRRQVASKRAAAKSASSGSGTGSDY